MPSVIVAREAETSSEGGGAMQYSFIAPPQRSLMHRGFMRRVQDISQLYETLTA